MNSMGDHEPVNRSQQKQTRGARKQATPKGMEDRKIMKARIGSVIAVRTDITRVSPKYDNNHEPPVELHLRSLQTVSSSKCRPDLEEKMPRL
jgi:hypothetical protein